MLTAAILVPVDPVGLRRLAAFPIESLLILFIFLITGLRLKVESLGGKTLWFEHLSIVAVTQFVAAPLSALLLNQVFALPEAWFLGIAAMCCVPTTLSTAVVMTRQADGNEMLAVLLTLALLLGGTLITPLWFGLLVGVGTDLSMPIGGMFIKFSGLVVAPLLLGQLIRRTLLSRPPDYLKHLPSLAIILLVGLVAFQHSDPLRSLSIWNWIIFFGIALLLHTSWMALCWLLSSRSGHHPRNRTALVLVGSQKTLPLALSLITMAFATGQGAEWLSVAISYAVIHHLSQTILDSLLLPALRQSTTTPRPT